MSCSSLDVLEMAAIVWGEGVWQSETKDDGRTGPTKKGGTARELPPCDAATRTRVCEPLCVWCARVRGNTRAGPQRNNTAARRVSLFLHLPHTNHPSSVSLHAALSPFFHTQTHTHTHAMADREEAVYLAKLAEQVCGEGARGRGG